VTSIGLISRAEKTSCGLTMAGSGEGLPELTGMALVTIIQDDGGIGRKRGARRSSLSEKTGRRRLRDDGRGGGADELFGGSLPHGGCGSMS
jgi:hypothetical protein